MIDLERDLHAAADAFDLPAGDLDAVRARGERRRARRTGVARGGALLAAVALVAGVTALGSGGDDDRTPVASEGAPTAGASAFTWSAHVPDAGERVSFFHPVHAAAGRLYALSTAPGQRELDAPQPKTTWTSSDGRTWSAVGSPPDLYLADLAGRGDRVYAVGTGPASGVIDTSGRAVPSALVGWSDDGTATFATAELPLDVAPIAAVSATFVSTTQVATVGDTVVVALGVRAEPDVPQLLPEGVDAPHGWAIDATGVTVLGAPKDGCQASADDPPRRVYGAMCDDGDKDTSAVDGHEPGTTYTWDELGVGGDVLAAVLGHPFVFAGDADRGFERVAVSGMPAMVGTFALDGGDLVLTPDGGGVPTLLRSADGRTWEPAGSLPAGLRWASTVGRVGERTVVVGEQLAVGGGGGWSTVDVAALLGDSLVDGEQPVLTTADIGPAGAVVAGLAVDEQRDGPGRWFVLTSRDGTSWAAEWLDDLAGAPVGTVGQVVAGDDRLVVQAGLAGERDAEGHVRQVALVGLPAAG